MLIWCYYDVTAVLLLDLQNINCAFGMMLQCVYEDSIMVCYGERTKIVPLIVLRSYYEFTKIVLWRYYDLNMSWLGSY